MAIRKKAEYTDEQLVELIINGESKYFGSLYERYREKVYSKCLGMTHNAIIAEDHTQDILMKAMQALTTYKGDAKFSTWLYSITYNHCIDYLRKHKRIRFDDWAELLEIPEENNEEEVIKIMELHKERLTLLLELLKPADKAIIILKYWEGMELERIQYILSIDSMPALKMKLLRARKRLRAFHNKFHPVIKA
ncbi:MAG: RNA polymerase sigma factor (sigma-70 family) [Parvicellaceae bacterium]|jgi:RNA polymerase sigma factor (sigma-70 family)